MRLSAKAQAAMNRVIKRFKSGDLSPVTEMARIRLDPDAPASKWSFNNRVLSYAQTGSLDCRGYRQWQSVGRQVQKGERSAFIFGPIVVPDKDDPEKTRLVGFRGIPVFGYHQTGGDKLSLQYEPKEPPPLMDVAERLGIAVRWGPMLGALGSCETDGEQLTIGDGRPQVFFHELAHACHAKLNGKLEGGQHEGQETVAEFTAAVLSEMYGIHHDGNAWKYISLYSDDPVKAVFKALSTVEKVLELIEGGNDE